MTESYILLTENMSLICHRESGKISQVTLSKTSLGAPETTLPHLKLQTQLTLDELDIYLEMSHFSPLQTKVYTQLCLIAPGQTLNYQEIAEKVGIPKGARAVGNCIGKNPFLGLIPCHRVKRKNGDLGGFSAGLHWKEKLLALEEDTSLTLNPA